MRFHTYHVTLFLYVFISFSLCFVITFKNERKNVKYCHSFILMVSYMKRILLAGVFLSVSIILLVQATSAVEYRAVIEHTSQVLSESEPITEFGSKIRSLPQPTCIRFLLNVIIGLFFSLIGTLFGILFGPLLAFIIKVLTAPAILLSKIILFLINVITFLRP